MDDPLDFAQVARSLGKTLFAQALRLTRDPERAADLVQDTYERAMRSRALPPAPDKIAPWIHVIMRNLFRDEWRARRRRSAREEPGLETVALPEPQPDEDPPWSRITIDQVRVSLQRLDPPFRCIYELYALEGLSYAEISARLALPRRTVGSRLFRARQKLRRALVTAADAVVTEAP